MSRKRQSLEDQLGASITGRRTVTRAIKELGYIVVDIDSVKDPTDPSRVDPEDGIEELVESIRLNGLLQAPAVYPIGDDRKYEIICGHRRVIAARRAGLTEIAVHVTPDAEFARLVENMVRKALHFIEEAREIQKHIDRKHSQTDIARRVGRSEGHISKLLSLLRLHETIQSEWVSSGKNIPLNTMYTISTYPINEQLDAWKKIRDGASENHVLAKRSPKVASGVVVFTSPSRFVTRTMPSYRVSLAKLGEVKLKENDRESAKQELREIIAAASTLLKRI